MLSISKPETLTSNVHHQGNREDAFISVYQTHQGIEVRPGCSDYINTRLVGSFASYEQAIDTANTVATRKNLPLLNYT